MFSNVIHMFAEIFTKLKWLNVPFAIRSNLLFVQFKQNLGEY